MDFKTAKKYCEEGHFAPGSMLPKVKAAMKFVEGSDGKKSLITSLEKAQKGLKGETGTVITN
jgi:carbamate kinase